MHMQKPYLEAGKIVNTHGVRGEVRIQIGRASCRERVFVPV